MSKGFGAETDPVMHVGKYSGQPISKLPLSYCRWIVMQDFPNDIIAAAKKKVDESTYSNLNISITRHAVDTFSLRFIESFLKSDARRKGIGLGTYIADFAQHAWDEGRLVQEPRYEKDGIVKALSGICFVFQVSPHFPDFKEVITVYKHESK